MIMHSLLDYPIAAHGLYTVLYLMPLTGSIYGKYIYLSLEKSVKGIVSVIVETVYYMLKITCSLY